MTDVIPLINISVQPIELCKLLKIANMVGGGGEAKIVISEGYVVLNNEVEFQKRTNQTKEALVKEEKNSKTQKTKAINKTQSNTNVKPSSTESTGVTRAKRKPISF